MSTTQFHAAAERLSRSRGISIREARDILSKRGAASRKLKREPFDQSSAKPAGAYWWQKDAQEDETP